MKRKKVLVGSAKDAENNVGNPENLLTLINGRLQLRTLTIRRKTAHRKTSVQCVQYAICSMMHNNTQNQEKESGDSMTDVKNTLTELELLKKYHTEIVEESKDGSVIKVHEGCLVAINHAINLIEDMEERIEIMAEGRSE